MAAFDSANVIQIQRRGITLMKKVLNYGSTRLFSKIYYRSTGAK